MHIKRLLYTTLFLACSISASAQLTSGLIAHWNFNGNANDASGNGLHGTPVNITYSSGKTGIANTAADFNGSSSVINVAYNAAMNSNAMSMCAIVRFRSFYNGQCETSCILQRGNYYAAGSYSLLAVDNIFDGQCNVYSPNNFLFHQKTSDIENYIPGDSMKYTPYTQKNQWYCVVTTYDGARTRIYVDGNMVATYSSARPKGTSTAPMCIGANSIQNVSVFPYWLDGEIDDLRIYNRALSDKDIKDYCSILDTTVSITDTTTRNICINDTFHLAYTTGNSFGAGNTFTAQLSDLSGSFANPVTLGSVTSATSGNIICNVPAGLLPGSGCLVRIISSIPVKTTQFNKAVTIYDKQPATIFVTATPTGPITQGQTVTYVAQIANAGNNPVIKWYRNGIWIANLNNDSLVINTLNDGDSIYAEVISNNPCATVNTTRSNAIYVSINTSVNNLQLQNFYLYPSPNSGRFTLQATNVPHSKLTYSVYNSIGQVIYKGTAITENGQLNEIININDASNGMYMLRLSDGGKESNTRFIINR